MDIRRGLLAIFLTIIALSTIYAVSQLGLIQGLPNDMRLGWGAMVLLWLIMAISEAGKALEERVVQPHGDVFGADNF